MGYLDSFRLEQVDGCAVGEGSSLLISTRQPTDEELARFLADAQQQAQKISPAG